MTARLALGRWLLLALALEFAWVSDPAAAKQPICGDGVIEGLEQCDDLNTVSGDGCSYPSCLPEVCGDGFTNPDPPVVEECDDGNTLDDDGCTFGTTPNCQLDCGDGEVDPVTTPPENCDDGNQTNGDGCDDDTSSDPPGNCSHTDCGNGVITPPEDCDPPSPGFCLPDCQIDGIPPDPGELRCIVAVNRSLAGVAKAEAADAARCVKDVAAGRASASCLGQDAKGKVARATAKTARTFATKCTLYQPVFAFTDAATVNAAGIDEVQEGVGAVLGVSPTIVARADPLHGAACQAEAMEQYAALVGRWLVEANKAKKSALRGGRGGVPPRASGPTELATGIDGGVSQSASLARAAARAEARLQAKCARTLVGPLFDCDDATTLAPLAACVIEQATRAACEALERADALNLTCP